MRGSWRLRTWRGQAYERLESLQSLRLNPAACVVINGFWRSGTTWLQEVVADALGARIVYEPFEASNAPFRRYARKLDLPRRDLPFVNAHQPWCSPALDSNPALERLVRRAIAGGWYGIWSPHRSDYAERRLSDVFYRQVVTKFVRANLCLPAIGHSLGVPLIHIYRDPRAVVASLTHPDPTWGGGSFQDFPLRAHLLETGDGRADYFDRWRDEIIELQGMPDRARLAAWYALTESCLADGLAAGNARHLIVAYSTLVRDGFDSVFAFLRECGFAPDEQRIDVTRPSISDKRKSGSGTLASAEARLNGWRKVLGDSETRLVTDIVTRFALADRCETAGDE